MLSVGQYKGLSSSDNLQVKCMYQCIAIGAGTLNVFLDYIYCGHHAYARNATEVCFLVVNIEAAD